jgi:hypothetical protein
MNLLDLDAPPSPAPSLCSSVSNTSLLSSVSSCSSLALSVGCPERLSSCAFDGETFCFDAALWSDSLAPRCQIVVSYLRARYTVSFTSDKSKASFFVTDAERAKNHNAKEQKRHVREFLSRWSNDGTNSGLSDSSMLYPIVSSSSASAGTKMFVHTAGSATPATPTSPVSLPPLL